MSAYKSTTTSKITAPDPVRDMIKATFCATCLSRDRKMFSIEGLNLDEFLPDIPLSEEEDRVCWECKAVVIKMNMFRDKVYKAQVLLQNMIRRKKCNMFVHSLSELKIVNRSDSIVMAYEVEEDPNSSQMEQQQTQLDIDFFKEEIDYDDPLSPMVDFMNETDMVDNTINEAKTKLKNEPTSFLVAEEVSTGAVLNDLDEDRSEYCQAKGSDSDTDITKDVNRLGTRKRKQRDYHEYTDTTRNPKISRILSVGQRNRRQQKQISVIAGNMAMYLECLPPEVLGPAGACGLLLQQVETLFRSISLHLPQVDDVIPLFRAVTAFLKVPQAAQHKSILEPISKIISFGIQNFVLKLSVISEMSVVCVRVFSRDRDKLLVCRVLVFELVQALRTKTTIPDDNLFILIQFVLQGHGLTLLLPPQLNTGDLLTLTLGPVGMEARELGSGAVDCMRPHMPDMIDLLQDPHLLNKIKGSVSKSIVNRNLICLNEDTLGAIVKGGIAQYVAVELALELARGKQGVGQAGRNILVSATASTQGGSREVSDCVNKVRLISWLVMGALCNAIGQPPLQQPIPQDATCHITDHIQTIMSSYVEQVKPATQRMNSLLHAFLLCQLWTLYLEEMANCSTPNSEAHNSTICILLDFWCKLVPSILQVTVQSKVLAETVNLHFLSLLESLLECNSTVLIKLMPLWTPILHSPLFTIPRHVSQRLDACREVRPEPVRAWGAADGGSGGAGGLAARAQRRLHRLLAKMAQLELQPQSFYLI